MVELGAPTGREAVHVDCTPSGPTRPFLDNFGGRIRLCPLRPSMVYRRIPSSDPPGGIARSSNLRGASNQRRRAFRRV